MVSLLLHQAVSYSAQDTDAAAGPPAADLALAGSLDDPEYAAITCPGKDQGAAVLAAPADPAAPSAPAAAAHRPSFLREFTTLLWRELLSMTRNPYDVAGRTLTFCWVRSDVVCAASCLRQLAASVGWLDG